MERLIAIIVGVAILVGLVALVVHVDSSVKADIQKLMDKCRAKGGDPIEQTSFASLKFGQPDTYVECRGKP
jgi:hypothetical protein